jgi:hypothetical protein
MLENKKWQVDDGLIVFAIVRNDPRGDLLLWLTQAVCYMHQDYMDDGGRVLWQRATSRRSVGRGPRQSFQMGQIR